MAEKYIGEPSGGRPVQMSLGGEVPCPTVTSEDAAKGEHPRLLLDRRDPPSRAATSLTPVLAGPARPMASPVLRDATVRMVVGLEFDSSGSTLIVRGPDRADQSFSVKEIPGRLSAEREIPHGSKPLALRIEVGEPDAEGSSFTCTCIITGVTGPRRIPVSAPTALALLANGCHGIVSAGRMTTTAAPHALDM